ncbi:uncharacterized protein LOC135168615 [Diachasmimorpha longicaudata]|uniref:uncharacterized protein LOC135168615 n=1 Tax=Diachasmimorpha longicaudata TaxID=58733 RepID=UPI0030B899D6
MRVGSTFFVIFGLLQLTPAEINEFPDEHSITHIDVQRLRPRSWKSHQSSDAGDIEGAFKIQWTGNGDFREHHQVPQSSLETELPPWDSQLQTVQEDSIDADRSSPSPVLQPPFEFYSSSIHNFANEDTSPESPNESSSSEQSSTIKTLRIYEITKTNSSWGYRKENALTTGRSFAISDPSSETKSFDSLRSAIRKKNTTRLNGANRTNDSGGNDGRANGLNDRSDGIIPRTNVIRANPGKANALRGNRKYQSRVGSDETSVRRSSWGNTFRHNWRRPVSRANHFRFSDSGEKVGAVPGVPGRDYPVNQEHTHHELQNVEGRFPCPKDPAKHFYRADRASRCQIFYVCFGGETGVPMVCPNGTLFNQEIQVCDWWFNVVC